MPTNEELLARIESLEAQTKKLSNQIKVQEYHFKKLKEWSDLNDYWLQEMINSLTSCVDRLIGISDDDEEEEE